MIDENGCDCTYTEERVPLVAVLPHPQHGRLVERVIMMASHCLLFKDHWYTFSWKEDGTAYYKPTEYCEPVSCRCH